MTVIFNKTLLKWGWLCHLLKFNKLALFICKLDNVLNAGYAMVRMLILLADDVDTDASYLDADP